MPDRIDYNSNRDVTDLNQDTRQEIPAIMTAWRVKTLNTVLAVVAILGSVSIIAFFAGGVESNQLLIAVFFLTTYLLILALAFYRRLDWHLRR